MATETTQQAPRQIPKFMNQIMATILRSPLHSVMSKDIMLLTFTGHKSGKSYTIPVGYAREGKQVKMFTDHRWYKNFVKKAAVTLRIQNKIYEGTAELANEDAEALALEMQSFIRGHIRAAGAFDVTVDPNGEPTLESCRKSVERFKLIRVTLI